MDEYEQLMLELAQNGSFSWRLPPDKVFLSASDQVRRCRDRGYSAAQARHIILFAPGVVNVGDVMNLIEAVNGAPRP